jgi:hypothetical protein
VNPLRGWLLLLALLLAVWEPVALGLLASGIIDRIVDRPLAIAVLMVRLLAAAVGLAAGVGLLARRPHAVTLAKASLLLLGLSGLLVHLTPWFPRNHPASLSRPLAVLTVAYCAAWFVYLMRSKQVRAIQMDGQLVPPRAAGQS